MTNTQTVLTTAIEAGPMEMQVCLLVETLRRFGGQLSNKEIIAVVPRLGPSLQTSTKKTLKRLGVEILTAPRGEDMSWFPFLNKTRTVKLVAEQVGGTIIWIDADVLALGEPSQLLISGSDIQFAACCSDKNIGTARDDDVYAPYFRACCKTLGVDYESLPYIVTKMEGIPIRAYWNAGIYAFESSTGFAQTYHEFTKLLLRKRIGSRACNLIMSDQISLGLAAHKLGLRYRELPLSHNLHVQPDDVVKIFQSNTDVSLLHYHGCLWPGPYEKLCRSMDTRYPEAANLLRHAGPLNNKYPLQSKIARKLFQIYRAQFEAAAVRQTTVF